MAGSRTPGEVEQSSRLPEKQNQMNGQELKVDLRAEAQFGGEAEQI